MEMIMPATNQYRCCGCGQGSGRCDGCRFDVSIDEDSYLRAIVPCGDMRPLIEWQRRGAGDG